MTLVLSTAACERQAPASALASYSTSFLFYFWPNRGKQNGVKPNWLAEISPERSQLADVDDVLRHYVELRRTAISPWRLPPIWDKASAAPAGELEVNCCSSYNYNPATPPLLTQRAATSTTDMILMETPAATTAAVAGQCGVGGVV